MPDIAIRVNNVSKVYPLYQRNKDRLLEAIHPLRKKYHEDFYALKDISFEIAKGETVGIIGQNGSGKSTLLKIITGVLTPTSGSVEVNGRVSSLLELGTGFNPEMSGIENVFFYGTINGISRQEMERKLDEILSFADIGEFVHQPVKTYSSGMFVRLAFACAIHVDPDILIVDEALSVGDMFFQAKCMIRMRRIIDSGVTILFVSHDHATIQSLCHRGILLEKGQIKMIGSAKEVSQEYFKKLHLQTNSYLNEIVHEDKKASPSNTDTESENNFTPAPRVEFLDGGEDFVRRCAERFGEDVGWIVNVKILNSKGEITNKIEYKEPFTVRIYIRAKRDIENYCVGFRIWDDKGISLAGTHTALEKINLRPLHKYEKLVIDFIVENIFNIGNYNVSSAIEIPIILNRNHQTLDAIIGADYFTIINSESQKEVTVSKILLKCDIEQYYINFTKSA